MKESIKNVIALVCRLVKPSLLGRASILMYHSIGDGQAFFTVKPEQFEKQLRYLRDKNFKLVFLSELVRRLKEGEAIGGLVAVTFDDGHQDFYTTVLPLIEKYQVPVSLFVPTSLIGGTLEVTGVGVMPLMSGKELSLVVASGLVEALPHTASHVELDAVDEVKLAHELTTSLVWLDNHVNRAQKILAYPRGRYSPQVLRALEAGAWEAAVTVNPGLVAKDSSLLELPRNSVDSLTTFNRFRLAVSDGQEWYTKLAYALRR